MGEAQRILEECWEAEKSLYTATFTIQRILPDGSIRVAIVKEEELFGSNCVALLSLD